MAQARLAIVDGGRDHGIGVSDDDGRFTMEGVPESIDLKKATYRIIGFQTGKPAGPEEVELIRTDPLVLRVNRQED